MRKSETCMHAPASSHMDRGYRRLSISVDDTLMRPALIRLIALFSILLLILIGGLVNSIKETQNEHYSKGQIERSTIIRQNTEILRIFREGE